MTQFEALAEVRRHDESGDVYRRLIDAFGDVTTALGDERERDELLHLVARNICALVGVRRCSLYLRDADGQRFRGQVGHWVHDIDQDIKRLTSGGPGDGFTREIVLRKAPVVVQDARSDPRAHQAVMRSWDVRSMLGVPMVLRGDVIGIVYLDDYDRAREFPPDVQALAAAFADLAAIAISQANAHDQLREQLVNVAKQNTSMRRQAAVDDRLTALVLEHRDLQEIAAEVAELTGRPCAIHDRRHRQLAVGHARNDSQRLLPRLLHPSMRSRPAIRRALARLRPDRPAVIEPVPNAGLHHRCLVAPITMADAPLGHLVIVEHGRRLTNLDLLVAQRASTVIAWALTSQRRAALDEWKLRAAVAAELIRGGQDPETLEQRAADCGMATTAPHAVCLITAPPEGRGELPDTFELTRAVSDARRGDPVLATGVAEGVALLVPIRVEHPGPLEIERLKTTLEDVLGRIAPERPLLAGISTVCQRLSDVPEAFAQALQVATCVESVTDLQSRSAATAVAAADLGAGRLFLATADATEATRFVEDTLGGLLADRKAESLLTTLDAFFRLDCSVRRTARAMTVHQNTVRYRLARSEELTGLAIATAAGAQLSVHLALVILRLRGRLAWVAPVGEDNDASSAHEGSDEADAEHANAAGGAPTVDTALSR